MYCIKIIENALKFGDIIVNKKILNQACKQTIALSLVDTDKIVVSGKFKYSDNGSKCFIGSLDDDDDNIIRELYVLHCLK